MPVTSTASAIKAGTVAYFAASTAPQGWLKCNGTTVSRTTYGALFLAIGTTYGSGDGSTTYNVPDLRGEFLRGLDDGRGVDSGRAIGTQQASQNLSHTHGNSGGGAAQVGNAAIGNIPAGGSTVTPTGNYVLANEGGIEARPRNVALLACIKF